MDHITVSSLVERSNANKEHKRIKLQQQVDEQRKRDIDVINARLLKIFDKREFEFPFMLFPCSNNLGLDQMSTDDIISLIKEAVQGIKNDDGENQLFTQVYAPDLYGAECGPTSTCGHAGWVKIDVRPKSK